MIEAVVRLRPNNNWICDIADEYSADIKILDCMPTEGKGGRERVEIRVAEDMAPERITEVIQNHPAVCNVDLSSMHNGKYMGEVVTSKCSACNALTASDCFLVFAASCGNGQIEWKIQTGQRPALFDLIKALRDQKYDVELISVTGVLETYNLTSRQEEIIRYALKKGYFDCPKKTNIRALARAFNISISTTSEILRRGVKKIVSDYFNEHQIML